MKARQFLKWLGLPLLIWSSVSRAQVPTRQEFIQIESGHEVYVEYFAPLKGRPTVVLVNGLVYDLRRWDSYLKKLTDDGVGVVRYNFRGQSKTLLREVEMNGTPKFFNEGIFYQDLAKELVHVLDGLGVTDKISVVGLSYGASIAAEFAATHPKRVRHLILMAPLVVSLDHYDPTGAWIRWNLDAVRFWWGPWWGPAAFDYYYNSLFRSYLVDQRLTPDRIPGEMSKIPEIYKEAIFHQVRAVRDFNLKSYDYSKGPKVTLMLASEEEPQTFADQLRAWDNFSPKQRLSLVYIEKSGHAIPDGAPNVAARLTLQILAGDKLLSKGKLFRANESATIECKDIPALKSGTCPEALDQLK